MKIIRGKLRKLTPHERKKYPKYKYVTLSKYYYKHKGKICKVPPGFLTDGSSGGPDYGVSWIFHDYLYATHKFESGEICSRQEADKVMKKILNGEKLTFYCWIFVILAKINIFCLFSRAWKKSGERGPEFLE